MLTAEQILGMLSPKHNDSDDAFFRHDIQRHLGLKVARTGEIMRELISSGMVEFAGKRCTTTVAGGSCMKPVYKFTPKALEYAKISSPESCHKKAGKAQVVGTVRRRNTHRAAPKRPSKNGDFDPRVFTFPGLR